MVSKSVLQANVIYDVKNFAISDIKIKFCNFLNFQKFRLLFKEYVTLWIKELLNVRDTIFVLSPFKMGCNKPTGFVFRSIIQKEVH